MNAIHNSSWESQNMFVSRYKLCKDEWLTMKRLLFVSSMRFSYNIFWSCSLPAPPRFDTPPSPPHPTYCLLFDIKNPSNPIYTAYIFLDVTACTRPLWSQTKQNPSIETGGGHEERILTMKMFPSSVIELEKTKCLFIAGILYHLYVVLKRCYS